MRDIKFRAYTYTPSRGYFFEYSDAMGGLASFFKEHDGEYISQYTSLKDRRGVEIYEGDCFYDGKDIVYVVFDSDRAKFVATWDSIPDWDMPVNMDAYPKNSLEIIGNIYENPELLR